MIEHKTDKSTDGQFPKNPCGLFIQKLCILIFCDIVIMMGVHEVDKINSSKLKIPFRGNGQFEPNLVQNCDTLCLPYCKKFTYCSVMRKNRWTVVLINFLKISPFQAKGQLRPNLVPIWPKIIQPYVWDFF